MLHRTAEAVLTDCKEAVFFITHLTRCLSLLEWVLNSISHNPLLFSIPSNQMGALVWLRDYWHEATPSKDIEQRTLTECTNARCVCSVQYFTFWFKSVHLCVYFHVSILWFISVRTQILLTFLHSWVCVCVHACVCKCACLHVRMLR